MFNIVLKEEWKSNTLLFVQLWQYGPQKKIWRQGQTGFLFSVMWVLFRYLQPACSQSSQLVAVGQEAVGGSLF